MLTALADQHVVIIGGSSGTGLATAHAASAAGARVTIVSSDLGRLNAALAELPSGSAGAVVDVRREADVADFWSRVDALDHLVVTAGDAIAPTSLADASPDEARRPFEVRFWGAVAAVRHAAPRLGAGASVALTSGTIGVRPVAGAALAAAAAGAVEGLVRGLAVELAPVRVNAVRPGVIRTPMWDAVPEARRETMFASLADRTLTRAIGEADQVARTHLYLMENPFVTGTVLTVDGGSVLT